MRMMKSLFSLISPTDPAKTPPAPTNIHIAPAPEVRERRARVNARKKFCANDVIPTYQAYYKRILSEPGRDS
jgi:hypothetical protein